MVKLIQLPDSLRREVQDYISYESWVPETPLIKKPEAIKPKERRPAKKLNLGTRLS